MKVAVDIPNKMGLMILLSIVAALTVYVEANSPEECPALFLRYTKTHTYCKSGNPKCNILASFVTQKDMNVILKEHNSYRSKLATGNEQSLPTAANMMQMVWDDELAAVSQKHANECLFEHDCGNCRRVQNYAVGQNLAIEQVTNSPSVPNPNWPSAIKSWYDEIQFFSKNFIDPFIAPPHKNTYGHFSQLVWAKSWRIGCGYVLYKEGDSYKKLYVCNYGPAGNIVAKPMYKGGVPCSACPKNSCCDKTCGTTAEYPGLCKITDGKAPTYKPEGSYIFYCDFHNQTDCKNSISGANKWIIYNTLNGNYLGITLNGGEESTIVFQNRIKPSTSSFCVVTHYRKGPNVAGQEDCNEVKETFTIIDNDYKVEQKLPDFNDDSKHQFSQFGMSLGWNMETQIKITFSVPPGKPPQFFEMKNIYVAEGQCPT